MASVALLTKPDASSASDAEQGAWIDWEAPAGGAACRRRLSMPRYIYRGGGDPHWLGQPCDLLEPALAGQMSEIVFACGCRATVSSAVLTAC